MEFIIFIIIIWLLWDPLIVPVFTFIFNVIGLGFRLILLVASLIILGAFLLSAFNVVYSFVLALKHNIKFKNYEYPNKDNEPAKVNYFFGPGYVQLKDVIVEGVSESRTKIEKIIDWFDLLPYDFDGIIYYILKVFSFIGRAGVFIVGVIGGGIVTVACLAIIGGISLMTMVLIFIIYMLTFACDRIYRFAKGIKLDCYKCKQQFDFPAYECPNCEAKHYKLIPNHFGIFHHTCTCGEKLPCTFFNGRSKLIAYCPKCDSVLPSDSTKSIIIQLTGGSSAGKTVFLSAFYNDYLKKLNKNPLIQYMIPDNRQESFENLNHYFSGAYLPDSTSETNAMMYEMIVKSDNLRTDRKFAIYDIAGEMANPETSDYEITQEQYRYCNGVILLIDPLSVKSIRNEAIASNENIDNYSQMEPDEVVNNFINYLIQTGIIKNNKVSNKPVAVVICKADLPVLKKKISIAHIKLTYKQYLKNIDEDEKAMTYDQFRNEKIKEFMNEYDMDNALMTLEHQFKNISFFVASAIGHEPDGEAYTPFGVNECFDWIIKTTDSEYYRAVEQL